MVGWYVAIPTSCGGEEHPPSLLSLWGHEEEGFRNMSYGHIPLLSLPPGGWLAQPAMPPAALRGAWPAACSASRRVPSGGPLAAGQLRASAGNCAADCVCIRRRYAPPMGSRCSYPPEVGCYMWGTNIWGHDPKYGVYWGALIWGPAP